MLYSQFLLTIGQRGSSILTFVKTYTSNGESAGSPVVCGNGHVSIQNCLTGQVPNQTRDIVQSAQFTTLWDSQLLLSCLESKFSKHFAEMRLIGTIQFLPLCDANGKNGGMSYISWIS